MQKGCVEAAFRSVPLEIPTVESLGLPPIVYGFGAQAQRAGFGNGSNRNGQDYYFGGNDRFDQ